MPTISSRTPEGEPNCCPVCGSGIHIEPSTPTGDAPCPRCGHLLWFIHSPSGLRLYSRDHLSDDKRRKITAVIERLYDDLGISREAVRSSGSFTGEVGADSLDIVELVMELEEEFDVTIPDEQAEKSKTIGEIIDLIIDLLIRKGPE